MSDSNQWKLKNIQLGNIKYPCFYFRTIYLRNWHRQTTANACAGAIWTRRNKGRCKKLEKLRQMECRPCFRQTGIT